MWGKVRYAVTASAWLQHAAREVGVQVEREHHPAAVPEIGAHLLEDVPLGIVLAVGGGGPVQVEDEDVERHRRGDPVEQGAPDLAEAGGAEASGGRAAEGGETGCGPPAGRGQHLEAAVHLRVGPGGPGAHPGFLFEEDSPFPEEVDPPPGRGRRCCFRR